jgi:hypothetical protein
MIIKPTKEDIELSIAIISQVYDTSDMNSTELATLLNLEFPDYLITESDVYRIMHTSELVSIEEDDMELIYKNVGL